MTNEIDWTKAPEGATHYDVSPDVYPWLKEDDNGNKFWYHDEWVRYSKSISETEGCIPKSLQPVFTKAMQDNNELPPVGSEVEFDTTFFTTQTSNTGTCEILAYHGDKVWANIMDFDCVISLNVIDFKPITPPIELIDGERYEFDHIDRMNLLGFYVSESFEFNVNGNHFSSEFSTNIKLLEVKS